MVHLASQAWTHSAAGMTAVTSVLSALRPRPCLLDRLTFAGFGLASMPKHGSNRYRPADGAKEGSRVAFNARRGVLRQNELG